MTGSGDGSNTYHHMTGSGDNITSSGTTTTMIGSIGGSNSINMSGITSSNTTNMMIVVVGVIPLILSGSGGE